MEAHQADHENAQICLVDTRTFEDHTVDSASAVLQEGCKVGIDVGRRCANCVLFISEAQMFFLVQGTIKAMVCHPAKPEFILTGSDGTVQRWCMHTKRLLSSHPLAHGLASCMEISRDGARLMVGYENGLLQLLKLDNMQEEIQFRNTFKPITHVAFAANARHMATMEENRYLALYRYGPVKGTDRWEYIGKYKSHHGEVVGLCFGEAPSGATRLFSLGKDGRILEYDLDKSSLQDGKHHRGRPRMPDLSTDSNESRPVALTWASESTLWLDPGVQLVQMTSVAGVDVGQAIPTAMCFAPPLPYHMAGTTNTMILIADDAYKVTMFDADHKILSGTYLGPTYAGPISSMVMFRSAASKEHHMAYATKERIVGLVAMPLDGNPEKSMGLIAHPGPIAAMDVSYDGRKMLTAGPDGIVNMWTLSTTSLDLAATSAQASSTKWAKILAGGEGEEAFREIQDYFLYAQIRAQGEETTAPRHMDNQIPVEALPDVLRALGYYPTKVGM